jgi:hypothetical protein
MTTRRLTIGVLLGCVLVLVAWDIYVYIEPTPGDTISETLFRWAGRHPIVPFAVGVLSGHWFWGQSIEKVEK